ncbi:MAG: methyltransferase domain-containing protein [Bacillota bacterium]
MLATNTSDFFETQFQRQVREHDFTLNPFERAALPYLHGSLLDFGCGLGNLALAAARDGCSVVALDASPAAIAHIRDAASSESLPMVAMEADLREYEIKRDFDVIVCIGLLMFFDCAAASRQLAQIQSRIRLGGIAVVNVLTEGTTYLDMFDTKGYCLFARGELERRFAGWELLLAENRDFPAPGARIKSFATVIARKPLA